MHVVKTLHPNGKWIVARKFWDWRDAEDYAYWLRRDGYDVRVVEES
jgi:hypothetical protein